MARDRLGAPVPPVSAPAPIPAARQRGFTLLEMLVALAVAAIALGTVGRGYVSSLTGGAEAGDRLAAIGWARSLLAELDAVTLGEGETRGEHPAGFNWLARVLPIEVEIPADSPLATGTGAVRPRLLSLEVTVVWPAPGGGVREITVASERLRVAAVANAPPGAPPDAASSGQPQR